MQGRVKAGAIALVGVLGLSACQSKLDDTVNKQIVSRTLAQQEEIPVSYPVTDKGNVVDDYFGQQVADPYRWLENDQSEQTAQWVIAQNEVTQAYLNHIPYREKIASTISRLIDYERVSAPFIEGQYAYFYKNDGLQNQSVLYRKKYRKDLKKHRKDHGKTQGKEALENQETDVEIFIDPNSFSDDGTVSLSTIEFSKDGSLAAYQTSTGGSDWRTVYVIDTDTMEFVGEPLVNVKFSGIQWYKNEGFYYASYDKPEGSELSDKTDQHKLYYHQVGSPQSTDLKVYGHVPSEKHRYVGAQLTDDSRFLLVFPANSTAGNRAYLKDLTRDNAPWVTLKDDISSDVYLLTSQADTLYLVTNESAPNTRVVAVNANAPSVENWQDLIPETEHVLSPSTAGGFIFAEYMVDAISKVEQYNLAGEKIRSIDLPGIGSVGSFAGKPSDTQTYFTFTNATSPSTIYALDIESGEANVFNKPEHAFKGEDFISEQVFYTSKDGTKVPMIITHHKDMTLDGSHPTILYGYGGFNVSLTPRFSTVISAWLEMGGIYAVPNIRGGGEYGKAWHRAGTQLQKQNTFDDFIAAAEYLIDKQYTSSERLALSGGSNGGLLVGAVMTQRPDLARVALPAVGVLDMLRYHTFTAGAGWAYDYGTSEQSEEMFEYLKAYSPVHNVGKKEYPATLVTTAERDDRVVPAHSFKFIAALQAHQQGNMPTLIRIEADAGHGAGTPVSKTIDEYADIFGFTLWNMGIRELD